MAEDLLEKERQGDLKRRAAAAKDLPCGTTEEEDKYKVSNEPFSMPILMVRT